MPYDYLTIDENGLNTGFVSASYFDNDLQKLYEQKFLSEYGFFSNSDDDIIEFSLYDLNQNRISFNRIQPKVTYSVVQGSYKDVNNVLRSYNYANPNTNVVRYDSNVLLHPQFDLNFSQVGPGQYYVLYNPIRNIAGNATNNLVIKEISPSRTELRLTYGFDTNKNEQSNLDQIKIKAFADKKYLFLQIEDELINIINNNPIEQDFSLNENQFNLYKFCQYLALKNKSELQEFISSTYEGFNKIIKLNNDTDNVIQQTKQFIGISQQIKNFTYSYYNVEFSKDEILESIRLIVLKVSQDRILEKTSLNDQSLKELLNFFQKIIYDDWLLPQITLLLDRYFENFYSFYKNALNFDNGNLFKIIDHTSYLNTVDNKINVQVKLDSPLPTGYDIKSVCWISNISISPIYFKVNLFTQQLPRKVFLNGVNFNVEVPVVNSSNQKFQDFDSDTLENAKVRLKQKINDLFINFDDFDQFINYSSAELRSKIAKNKILKYQNLDLDKTSIANKASNSVYSVSASYSNDYYVKTQEQINLLNTFDDYEAYLFFNTSSINEKIETGVYYDKNNYNSLVYQLPEYVKTDVESSDYIKFTAMMGHFFDNILVFIKKFPKNYTIKNNDASDYPKNYIEELLNSLNWNDDILNFEQSSTKQLFFNRDESKNSLSSSYFDYAKSILNRLTNNISAIYKSKGTSTSFNLIRTIFGIPAELINIKEYGSSDIITNQPSFYNYDDIIYMADFKTNNFINLNYTSSEFIYKKNEFVYSGSYFNHFTKSIEYVSVFNGVSTIEFSFKFKSKDYDFKDKIPLLRKIRNKNDDWNLYIKKTKQDISGQLIFEFYPKELGVNGTSSMLLQELPLLNGDVYTVMLRRELVPNYNFDFPIISSSFEKNEITSKVLENQPTFDNFVVEDDNDFVILFPVSSSFTSSTYIENQEKYAPYLYTLKINQYDGSQKRFTETKQKVYTYDINRFFSSGSYYFANYSSSQNFIGNLDKIKMFRNPVADDDFEEHSYNLNSISTPFKNNVYSNLIYLWSFDTPISLYSSSSIIKLIPNQNVVYNTNNFYAANFQRKEKYFNTPICKTLEVEEFPYNFDKLNLKQAVNTNDYGPNFTSNNKINKITQTVSSNLVPYDFSTSTSDVLGDDSSLVQFGFSPYNYLNSKIQNFLGKDGIANIIGDPKYLTSRYYPELKKLQTEFSKLNQRFIYPQEFYSTYKFYIDFSIFDFVKSLKPTRANLINGMVLQPSLLERQKFNYKDIKFENESEFEVEFNNSGKFTSSIITTDFTSSNVSIQTFKNNRYIQDNNTYNYFNLEIKDKIDDRDFIFSKFGKLITVDKTGFIVRNNVFVDEIQKYQLINNLGNKLSNNDWYVTTFSSSYQLVNSIGSGSGYFYSGAGSAGTGGSSGTAGIAGTGYPNQVTGSRGLTNFYKGIRNSGYSKRHLSKFNFVGSRVNYIAISGSKYTIQNGLKILVPASKADITYYKYTKGKNDNLSTVNRQGILNGSEPIITIPGFLGLDIDSDNFPIYGELTGSVGNPSNTFKQLPLSASQCTSASLNTYIMNL